MVLVRLLSVTTLVFFSTLVSGCELGNNIQSVKDASAKRTLKNSPDRRKLEYCLRSKLIFDDRSLYERIEQNRNPSKVLACYKTATEDAVQSHYDLRQKLFDDMRDRQDAIIELENIRSNFPRSVSILSDRKNTKEYKDYWKLQYCLTDIQNRSAGLKASMRKQKRINEDPVNTLACIESVDEMQLNKFMGRTF